jgi:hypothetical protein
VLSGSYCYAHGGETAFGNVTEERLSVIARGFLRRHRAKSRNRSSEISEINGGNNHRDEPFVIRKGRDAVSLGTLLLIILVVALLGGFSGIGGGPFYGTGYYGGGGLGIVLVVVLILVLLGRL